MVQSSAGRIIVMREGLEREQEENTEILISFMYQDGNVQEGLGRRDIK